MGKATDDQTKQAPAPDDTMFLAETVLPEAAAAFAPPRPPIASAIATADVVLDTNVLLLPYRAGPGSLQQIETALSPLRDQGRLFIPARVAREFARHRPTKITELVQALSSQSSRVISPEEPSYALLQDLPQYQALQEAVTSLKQARTTYQSAVSALRESILLWEGNDPVSDVYSRLFPVACIRDPAMDRTEVAQELSFRKEHKIPPGYKDSSKPDSGVGDLIIWKTILDLGRERKKPLVFVTGEEKADWQHRTDNRGILPRFELIDEFRRSADGASFYILQMSELLELLKAGGSAVAEIRHEEERTRDSAIESAQCPHCASVSDVALGPEVGASALPRCASCSAVFHVHRGRDGVFVRAYGGGRTHVRRTVNQVLLQQIALARDEAVYARATLVDGHQPPHGFEASTRELLRAISVLPIEPAARCATAVADLSRTGVLWDVSDLDRVITLFDAAAAALSSAA